MGDSFSIQCKDFVKEGKVIRKGCLQTLMMKKLPDGKWKPFNLDGTPHVHAEVPKESKKVVQLPITDRETFIVEVIDRRLRTLGLLQ